MLINRYTYRGLAVYGVLDRGSNDQSLSEFGLKPALGDWAGSTPSLHFSILSFSFFAVLGGETSPSPSPSPSPSTSSLPPSADPDLPGASAASPSASEDAPDDLGPELISGIALGYDLRSSLVEEQSSSAGASIAATRPPQIIIDPSKAASKVTAEDPSTSARVSLSPTPTLAPPSPSASSGSSSSASMEKSAKTEESKDVHEGKEDSKEQFESASSPTSEKSVESAEKTLPSSEDREPSSLSPSVSVSEVQDDHRAPKTSHTEAGQKPESPEVSAPAASVSTNESKKKKGEQSNNDSIDLDPSFDPNVGTVAADGSPPASGLPMMSFSATAAPSVSVTKAAQDPQTPTNDDAGHFLGHEAPPAGIAGPFQDEPRSVDSALEVAEAPGAEEPGILRGPLLKKTSRRADASPDMNDILSGLLNVVGEGLNIANNYVKNKEKEDTKRKQQQEQQQQQGANRLQSKVKNVSPPATRRQHLFLPPPTRINNRGPPRFTEIPFEAIPLEVLSTPRPGLQSPHQRPHKHIIRQRPFASLPPGAGTTRVRVTKTRRKPPYATGVPLPELLVPMDGEGHNIFPTRPFTLGVPTSTVSSHEITTGDDELPDDSTREGQDDFSEETEDGSSSADSSASLPPVVLTTTENLIKLVHTYFPDRGPPPALPQQEEDNLVRPPQSTTTTERTATSTSKAEATTAENEIFLKPTTPEVVLKVPPRFPAPPQRRPRPPKRPTGRPPIRRKSTVAATTAATTRAPPRTSKRPPPPFLLEQRPPLTRRPSTTTHSTTTTSTTTTTRRPSFRPRPRPTPPLPTFPTPPRRQRPEEIITGRPMATSAPPLLRPPAPTRVGGGGQLAHGETFDVTVRAQQNFGAGQAIPGEETFVKIYLSIVNAKPPG